MQATPACPMLHHGIRDGYGSGVGRSADNTRVETLVLSDAALGAGQSHAGATLFQTSIDALLGDDTLVEEIFGPATLLVTYDRHEVARGD